MNGNKDYKNIFLMSYKAYIIKNITFRSTAFPIPIRRGNQNM